MLVVTLQPFMELITPTATITAYRDEAVSLMVSDLNLFKVMFRWVCSLLKHHFAKVECDRHSRRSEFEPSALASRDTVLRM